MATKPSHLLLVEDDLTTAHFFQTVLQGLPATLDWARSCKQALGYAQNNVHDLWLIDLHLPDGTGMALLSHLRAQQSAIAALAHTAELNIETEHALKQAGFVEILIKPFSAPVLLNAVQRALAGPAFDDSLPHWDEAAALRALAGQRQHLHTLRQLFLAELPATRDALYQAWAQGDQTTMQAQLHRLKASCGFVGAVQLEQAARQLQQNPDSPIARQLFDAALSRLLY